MAVAEHVKILATFHVQIMPFVVVRPLPLRLIDALEAMIYSIRIHVLP